MELLEESSGVFETPSGEEIIRMKVDKYYPGFPEIPNEYALIGSGARALLELNIGLISELQVQELRDYDIMRISEVEPYYGADKEIAEKYMPDDLRYGYGVKKLDDNYFSGRDFTFNEVYYHNGELYFTRKCYNDLRNSVIRLTPDTYKTDYGNHDFKNVIKALRLLIERRENFPNSKIEFINAEQLRDPYVNLFLIALNLDKAYFSGISIAECFLKLLQEIGYLPNCISTLGKARQYLYDNGNIDNFEFKYLPRDLNLEAELVELLDDYFYEYHVVGDKVLEILDALHPHEESKIKRWRYK